MPPNTVYVGRPSKWGNPQKVDKKVPLSRLSADLSYFMSMYEDELDERGELIAKPEIKKELKGKNLACWYPLDQICHADTLLKIANS